MAAKSGFNLDVLIGLSSLPFGYPYPPVLQTEISNKGNLVAGRMSPRENMLFCRTVSS